MALKDKIKKNFHNWAATIAGLVVAVAAAWIDIEWSTFDWSRDYMKLVVSGVIALGGWVVTFKKKEA